MNDQSGAEGVSERRLRILESVVPRSSIYYIQNLDWSHLEGHATNRSERHPGDVDIPVMWAAEAFNDTNGIVIDPDYNSKSGQSIRVVGLSETTECLITVIIVREEGRFYGASAWRSNEFDKWLYRQQRSTS